MNIYLLSEFCVWLGPNWSGDTWHRTGADGLDSHWLSIEKLEMTVASWQVLSFSFFIDCQPIPATFVRQQHEQLKNWIQWEICGWGEWIQVCVSFVVFAAAAVVDDTLSCDERMLPPSFPLPPSRLPNNNVISRLFERIDCLLYRIIGTFRGV